MKLVISTVYAELVPPLTETEYQSLKESIRVNHLWIPITINKQGVILDGHHRYNACQEVGEPVKYVVKEFESELLEKKFVILVNLDRRQLDDPQRYLLGKKLEPINYELNKKAQQEAGEKYGENHPKSLVQESTNLSPNDNRTTARTAKEVGLKRTQYERLKKIEGKASPEEWSKVLDGKTTISKAYHTVQKNEKREVRQAEIKNLQVNLPDTVTLYNQEFQTVPVPDNSVSLIITDPPYHEKYLYLFEHLAKHAMRVLKDGGVLLTYVGNFNMLKVGKLMEDAGLTYHWTMAIIHSGPSASVFGRKILVGYKPMLMFVKGKYEGEFIRDTIQSEFQGKELHEWAQSTKESDYYIKYLTIENEIVYDPFLGSGTFGLSAIKLKRQFIGCEIDPEHFATAERLISHGG